MKPGSIRMTIVAAVSAACAQAASPLETPTHKEIAPIQFPIGAEGLIKTISMDSRGNLLVGVSWKSEAAAKTPDPATTPSAPSAAKPEGRTPQQTLARLNEAITKNTPQAWDQLLKDITADDFREVMSNASNETRREIMPHLPENVRAKLMQGRRERVVR